MYINATQQAGVRKYTFWRSITQIIGRLTTSQNFRKGNQDELV
jgi:hypothetical protein